MIAAALALVAASPAPRRRRTRGRRRRARSRSIRSPDREARRRRRWSTSTCARACRPSSRRSPTIRSSAASSASAASACRRSASRTRSARASSSVADGVVVTNTHVIKTAAPTEIRIALADKREFDAKVVAQDDKTDIAVLQDRGRRRRLPVPRVRGQRHARGRRPGARHRQSVRRRPDGDQRHRLGAGAHRDRRSPTRRCSSRPTPPSIPATRAARWSTWTASSSASTR